MQRINSAEIARLTRSGNIVTLEITARQIVTVPREIAEKTAAQRISPGTGPAIAPVQSSPEPDRTPDTREGETL